MFNCAFIVYLPLLNYLFVKTDALFINRINKINRGSNKLFQEIDRNRYNPFSKKYYEELSRRKNNETGVGLEDENNLFLRRNKNSLPSYIEELKRLNSRNTTVQNNSILGLYDALKDSEKEKETVEDEKPQLRIILNKSSFLSSLGIQFDTDENISGNLDEDDESDRRGSFESKKTKSKNFEVIKKFNVNFKNVGGYENVKQELNQCVDILKNYKKYAKYNVRIPKGLILEGPPGTGKTLLAKALAGEAKCNFIPVSGSDFQEKYVGVGSSRIKELFELAKKNIPCIIFIDEIDALGRKRSTDGEMSSSERDSTLNSLLVELDGFKNNTGIFLVAATNRIDLLDSALVRPGRIDKKICIGLPDSETREAIIKIHIEGKPHNDSIVIDEIVEVTEGYSGAQIENLLNEAMLNALKFNRTVFCYKDFDLVLNKMIAGWQPNEHKFTADIINHIVIHEMGHALVGLLSKHHSKVSKVVINLSSPNSPGYTLFEGSTNTIYKREALFEHLMILLAGRIAEEVFYGVSVTTGAINDFEEALKLAEKMIIYYGMGNNIIYPSLSEKYKEMIDIEVINLLDDAYKCAHILIENSGEFILETSEILKEEKIIKVEKLNELLNTKYKYLENLQLDLD
jgi:cell division protease FtsH